MEFECGKKNAAIVHAIKPIYILVYINLEMYILGMCTQVALINGRTHKCLDSRSYGDECARAANI